MNKKTSKKVINPIKKEWKNIMFNLIFAILSLSIVIIINKNIILTTILLGIISLIGLFYWKSRITVMIFIHGAIFGTLAEIIAIKFNVWNYSFTNLLNIPSWLFILWGNAAASIYEVSISMKNIGFKK